MMKKYNSNILTICIICAFFSFLLIGCAKEKCVQCEFLKKDGKVRTDNFCSKNKDERSTFKSSIETAAGLTGATGACVEVEGD